MNDFLTLTKLLFKANYSIDVKTKKGRQSLLVGLLVLICLLPSLFLVYAFFSTTFISYNLDLLMIQLGFGMACFLIVWEALFLFPSVFYFSNDLEHLLVLPVTPTMIVSAKFLIVYCTLALTSVIVLIPMFAAYIISGADVTQIVMFLIQIPIISLVPTFVVSTFWIIVLRLMPFFHNKDRFNLITGILSILIAVGIGAASGLLSSTSVEDPTMLINMLKDSPESLSILSQIFFNIPFASRAIVNTSIIDLIIHIVLIVASAGLFYICSKHLYLVSALNSKGSSSKKKIGFKSVKAANPTLSYLKADFYKLVRTPAYFSNCILSSFVGPIIMTVIFFSIPDFKTLKEMLMMIDFTQYINLPLYLFIGGIVVGFFFGSMNGISATAFSREGKNLPFMLYVPIDFKKQLLIKEGLGIVFSLLTCVMMLIPVHLLIPYPIYYDIAFVLGALITTTFINQLALIIDGIHPKLNWEDEMSAIKNNLNVMFELLSSWAILALLVAPLFLFELYNHLEIYISAITVILIVLIVVMYIISPKIILKSLNKSN